MPGMTETHASSEPATGPVATATPPPPRHVPPAPAYGQASPERRPSKLYRAAAWVVIVAGVVFIVAVVFFTGFILGRQTGGGHHRFADYRDRVPMMPMERQGPPFVLPGGPNVTVPQPPQPPGAPARPQP